MAATGGRFQARWLCIRRTKPQDLSGRFVVCIKALYHWNEAGPHAVANRLAVPTNTSWQPAVTFGWVLLLLLLLSLLSSVLLLKGLHGSLAARCVTGAGLHSTSGAAGASAGHRSQGRLPCLLCYTAPCPSFCMSCNGIVSCCLHVWPFPVCTRNYVAGHSNRTWASRISTRITE